MANGSRLGGSEGTLTFQAQVRQGHRDGPEQGMEAYWAAQAPAAERGARHREEAAARPPSDSERSVLAPLLSSSRGRERRYYVVLGSSLNYYSLRF